MNNPDHYGGCECHGATTGPEARAEVPYATGGATHAEAGIRWPTREAESLVMGDRQASYGHPASDFAAMGRITAALLSRYLERIGYVAHSKGQPCPDNEPVYLPDIAPEVVALIQQAVKISREAGKPKRDNRVDGIGYWLCADRIIEDY